MRNPAMRLSSLWLVVAILLGGCGFKLQGSYRWPEQWPGYQLSYSMRQPGMAEFAGLLDQALQHRGLTTDARPQFQLRMTGLDDGRYVAAIGGDGKAVEYELSRTVQYQLVAGSWSSPVWSQSARRRLSYDPNQALAKDLEEARLRQALSRELIDLMLLRAEGQLRELLKATD